VGGERQRVAAGHRAGHQERGQRVTPPPHFHRGSEQQNRRPAPR
jgi:hypothetical protein